jgi:hypothetical protein
MAVRLSFRYPIGREASRERQGAWNRQRGPTHHHSTLVVHIHDLRQPGRSIARRG